MRFLAVVISLVLTSTAFAQSGTFEPSSPAAEYKSATTAMLWAGGLTLAGVAMVGVANNVDNGAARDVSLLAAFGLAAVGPSAGHLYADDGWHVAKVAAVRTGGLLLFAYGAAVNEPNLHPSDVPCMEECGSDEGDSAMWIGGIIVAATTLYDLIDVRRAVKRYNDRSLAATFQLAPAMIRTRDGGTSPSLAVTGTF